MSSEWRIFFPPLRDRLLRQFGISESLSLKTMLMVHIAKPGHLWCRSQSWIQLDLLLSTVGDAVRAGIVVSGQKDFFTRYSI